MVPRHKRRLQSEPSNTLTTDSDFDVPVATSDTPPILSSQSRSSPRRSSRLSAKKAQAAPRGRTRAATTTPAQVFRHNTRKGKDKGKAFDTLRDAVSEGIFSSAKSGSAWPGSPHESEDLPQLPGPEVEPLPRASLSPPPEVAVHAGPWFRDDNGLRYAYPPERPADPKWYDRMQGNVESSYQDFEKLLVDMRREVNARLSHVTLAEFEVDEQLELYQELLQDIQKIAGTEFVEGLAAKIGCWQVEEGEVGIEVNYRPQDGDTVSRPPPSNLAAFNAPNDDGLDPSDTPYGTRSSPAPESPSLAPSVRAQKRRREQPPPPPPPKRPRVFSPPHPSARVPTRVRDSSLPPSSPIYSVFSPQSQPHRVLSDPAPSLPTDPVSVHDTEPNTSFLGPIPPSPKASGYIRDHSFNEKDVEAVNGEPIATDPTVDAEPRPTEPQQRKPRPSFPFKPVSPLTREEEMRRYPWYIPPRSSELDIKMDWPPDPNASAGEGSGTSGTNGQDRDGAGGQEEDDSGIVPKKTTGEQSPWRDVNTSIPIIESASGAIGHVKRAALRAKARPAREEKMREEREKNRAADEPIARLKDPNFMPYGGIAS
ncbi:hypothetical protein DICSQDRAFT_170714 [Dichomitus squalens LYAD-421 SS1]|uniref:Uncharacterized protein n=1 Tax=Dichomitus squalens (strain LYAD-421) TaxID=732165 RepID=R7T0Z9_DICSQ|nr:uncharacterized protein DICSQDRAFT_170714 [Dichomitus squalens LYAD-421 SS1]EJF60852.1 hypothetical protein DICSQDRAFT_170714 [Dichomitus squalens LYAD-421 SS1]